MLSKEEFNLPCDVTGLATLRTTFTKQGLVAFNVGVIDPFFKGPISTVLLNFSKRTIELEVGDKFFRILFFKHDDVSDFHSGDESVSKDKYEKDITSFALNDYSQSFLDINVFDNDFYSGIAKNLLWGLIWKNKLISVILAALFLGPIVYLWTQPDYLGWFDEKRKQAVSTIDSLKEKLGEDTETSDQ